MVSDAEKTDEGRYIFCISVPNSPRHKVLVLDDWQVSYWLWMAARKALKFEKTSLTFTSQNICHFPRMASLMASTYWAGTQ